MLERVVEFVLEILIPLCELMGIVIVAVSVVTFSNVLNRCNYIGTKDKKLTKYLISDRMFTFLVLNIKIYFRVSNRKDFIR